MPRNQTAVECFFCGSAPCVCNKKSRKPAGEKSKQASPAVAEKPARKFVQPNIKVEPFQQPPRAEPAPKFKADDTASEKSKDDMEFEAALRNLGPILADSEKKRYPEIFGEIQSKHERKIVTWRVRNGLL